MDFCSDHFFINIEWQDKEDRTTECDTWTFLTDNEGNIPRRYDIIFYNNPGHRFGGLKEKRKKCGSTLEIISENIPEKYRGLELFLAAFHADEPGKDIRNLEKISICIADADGQMLIEPVNIDIPEKYCGSIRVGHLSKNEENSWTFTRQSDAYEQWKIPLLTPSFGLEKWSE